MKQIRQRLTYANVISTLALFLLLGGGAAIAASGGVPRNSVGTKQLKKNSVSAEKIKREAVSSPKLRAAAVIGEKIASGAVSAAKLQDGSVSTEKLAEGAVTSTKLEPPQRSEAIAFSAQSSFDLFDSYEPQNWTTVMSATLPEGKWVLNADIALSISTNVPSHVGCRMSENGSVLAQGGTEAEQEGASVPSYDGIALSALGSQGTVSITCGDDRNGTTALYRSLIARRVGSVGAG